MASSCWRLEIDCLPLTLSVHLSRPQAMVVKTVVPLLLLLQTGWAFFGTLQSPRLSTALRMSGTAEQVAMEKVLFVEVGFGCDQHGQNPTKAAVRACRNAIEFNSIPSISSIVPGGYDNMKLRVQIAIPSEASEVDEAAVRAVFPYGKMLPIEFQRGGMRASSGIAIEALGDKNDDMIIAVACVTVGY